ncbi:GYD domain-containing protein [Variovorax sp. J22P240]|uniref:GYD domain-containing protein n=1 Tax=unclassified Variovorax TaxID=663243 RepID=UPI0025777B8F|nr:MULTISPECIES: GYD domain-containing protein [unclassified Variovorax]MDL9999741.1 GYD domain-containing protein [Variovorax sp. J22P240]MDM0049165.1 GYD domain-containing protein [Variovorax sp. J22R115]
MSTFISLVNFTDQGIRNVKESPNRAEAFKGLATKLGLSIKSMYWTSGTYDLVIVTEGSDEAAMAGLLSVGSLGNVRSQTLRAYSADEIKKIIALMP